MKYYSRALIIVIILATIFVIGMAIEFDHSNIIIKSDTLKPFQEMRVSNGINPCEYKAKVILNIDFIMPQTLLFKTSHLRFKIYVNEKMVYSFGYEENAVSFLKSPGTSYHLVELPAMSSNKEIVFDFQSPYSNYHGFLPDIQYGTKGECIAYYQNKSMYSLFSLTVVLLGGLTIMILYFVTKNKKYALSKSFLYISSFIFLVSIWLFFQSDSCQLMFGYPQIMYFADLISLVLFPVPLNLYIYDVSKNEKRKYMLYFAYAYAATLVLNLLLQVFGLVDMFQLVLLTHSLMALNMIVAVYVVHVELRIEKNKDLRMFIVPLALVSAGGLLEMILYYYSNMTQTSFALRIAVVAFLVVIIINAIKSYYDNLLELKQAEYYEQLASVDMLTNLGNRNKYEQFLQSHEPNQPLTAVLFDLNYLKYINDNFGHVVGDSALKKCAECIKEAFSNKGECFRIGGDEFAVLTKADDNLQKECHIFEKLVQGWNKRLSYIFSVAYGVARFNPKTDQSAYDTAKRADFAMYHMKEEQKRKIIL